MPSLSFTSWYLPQGVSNFHSQTSPCLPIRVIVPYMLQCSNYASIWFLPAPEFSIFLPNSPILLKQTLTIPILFSFLYYEFSSYSQFPIALSNLLSSMNGRRTSPNHANFLPVRSISNSEGKQSAIGESELVMRCLKCAGSAVEVLGGRTAMSCSKGLKGYPSWNSGISTTSRSEKKGEQWKGQYHDQLATPRQQYRHIQLSAQRYEVLM